MAGLFLFLFAFFLMEHAVKTSEAFGSALRWMVASMCGKGNEHYKNDPKGYEAVAQILLGRAEVAKSIREVIDRYADGERELVLDAACGTGLVTHELAGSAKRVLGMDVCEEALAFARKSKNPSLEFAKGDLHDFSGFEPQSIDAYSLCFASRYINDKQLFFRSLASRLCGNGVAVITSVGHAKRLKDVERCANEVELSMNVIQPRFRSLFNRMHRTAHVVLQHKH